MKDVALGIDIGGTNTVFGIVNKKVVNWKFLNGENYLTWKLFLLNLDCSFCHCL